MRPRAWNLLVVAVVLGTMLLAAAGLVLAGGIIATGASHEPKALATPILTGPFGTAQDIPTSFGVVAVEHASKINGTTAKQTGGPTHGISGFVAPDKVQVQASVTLTNLLDEPIDYDPRQFRLLHGKAKKPVGEVRSSVKPGTLQPDAAIDARLTFIAPRNGDKLWIEFTDPGATKPILIDLGRTGKTPEGAFDGFNSSAHGGDHK
ncbi:hypothetical protein BH20ACT16_BH20ACT16_02580 [soil metagenome]